MTSERCLLIIDDSAVIRQIAKMTLGSRGWRILTAETGPEGIAMAASERPDAVRQRFGHAHPFPRCRP